MDLQTAIENYASLTPEQIESLIPAHRLYIKELRRQDAQAKAAERQAVVASERLDAPSRQKVQGLDRRLLKAERQWAETFEHQVTDKYTRTTRTVGSVIEMPVKKDKNGTLIGGRDRQADGMTAYLTGGGAEADRELASKRYAKGLMMADIKKALLKEGIGASELGILFAYAEKAWDHIVSEFGHLVVRPATEDRDELNLEDAVSRFFWLRRQVEKLENERGYYADRPIKPIEPRKRGNK